MSEVPAEIITDKKWQTIVGARNLLDGLMGEFPELNGENQQDPKIKKIMDEFHQRACEYCRQDAHFTTDSSEALMADGYEAKEHSTITSGGLFIFTALEEGGDFKITEGNPGSFQIWRKES